MFGMTSNSTENYVDKTLENPSVNHWIPYDPPSKKFSSKFPSPPQHATDRSLDAKTKEPKQYEMYISENNGKVFMISVISFLKGDKSLEGESVLKAVVDDMVASNPGNKLDKIQFGYLTFLQGTINKHGVSLCVNLLYTLFSASSLYYLYL